jgi:hypothetical protein
MSTARHFLIASVLLVPFAALRSMTRWDLATSTSACAAASKSTDGVGYDIKQMVSSTDTTTARYRGLLGLPQMASTAVTVDVASSECGRLLTAYQAKRGYPAAHGQLFVWRLANGIYYAAYDPYGVRGTRAVLFFKADWTFLSMMPTDY